MWALPPIVQGITTLVVAELGRVYLNTDFIRGWSDFREALKHLPEPHTEEATPIHHDKLSAAGFKELHSQGLYRVGISRKPAFMDWLIQLNLGHIQLSHCSIVLERIDPDSGEVVPFDDSGKMVFVLGRQSPYFAPSSEEPYPYSTTWDNEHKYEAFMGTQIFLHTKDESAIFSGAEIKMALGLTEQHVHEDQLCDMYRSNCYSSSVFFLSTLDNLMAEKMNRGEAQHPEAQTDAARVALRRFLHGFCQDHKGVGILDNPKVMAALWNTSQKPVRRLEGDRGPDQMTRHEP